MTALGSEQPQLIRHALDDQTEGEISRNKKEPRLPQEIINMILRQVNDPPFLWTTCRHVSQSFRKEVEYVFEKTWLRETTVMWPRNPKWNSYLDCYNCRLSRLSDDGLTAYFTVHSWGPETSLSLEGEQSETIVSLEDEQSADSRELKDLITAHINRWTTSAYMDQSYVVTCIGPDANNKYFTNAAIPSVVMHGATSEISLDWKALFTIAFGEVQQLLNIKAATGCDLLHERHWDLDYPIVFTSEEMGLWQLTDYAPYLKVFDRRGVILGWFSEEESRALPPSYYKSATFLIRRLEAFISTVCINGIFDHVDGDCGESRGVVYWVQDPAQNGWTRNHSHGRRTDWVNHAWENPRDGGRTTWSEDPLVIEVEGMARAWEKGLA